LFLSQIILARLLSPEDFGSVGLTYTITAIIGSFTASGIGDVLLQRSRTFHLWAWPAFWIDVILASIGVALVLFLAPLRRQALRRSRDYGPCIGAGNCNARRSAVDRSIDRDSALVEFQAIGNDRHGGSSSFPKSVNLARMVRHGLLQLCSTSADHGRLQDSLAMDDCPTAHASPTTPTSVAVSHQEWPFGLERQASERINWARRLLRAWPLRLPRGCRALFFCL
jgi:Polysaccharide biosynthesis protein